MLATLNAATSNRWHFDALSDDGRDALIITFADHYNLSPRSYSSRNGSGDRKNVPAVSFRFFSNGKLALSSINEFQAEDFSLETGEGLCTVGASSFRVESVEYGTGYLINVDLLAARKRRIKAEIEWLSVEAGPVGTAGWHVATPRSDVSGRITLVGRRGATRKVFHLRGTGYHDRFSSPDPQVGRRAWGRAHFVDATAIFDVVYMAASAQPLARLLLIRDGAVRELDPTLDVRNSSRDRYGLVIPGRLQLSTPDNIRVRIKPVRMIQSGFFEARALSEVTLMLRDGRPRKTIGILEFADPSRLKNPVFRWISDLRIGKNGRPPLL